MLATRTSLSSRPLDLLYFTFFMIHLPASLLVDCQALYPPGFVPGFMSNIVMMYTQFSADPLISGAMGYAGESKHFVWFKTFIFVEIFFQVPVFIIGMRGLWQDSRSIYLLLLAYGASTATTTLPCLTVLLTSDSNIITTSQYFMLLSSYLPFFLLPLFMAIDMSLRIAKLLQTGSTVEVEKKIQ